MTDRFPDIEIYLMNAEADAVLGWLRTVFAQVEIRHANSESQHWLVDGMDFYFTEKAEKNFSSLWIKQNSTPWLTDLECARAAHAALACEIRCSDSGWQESEGEDSAGAGWIKLIRGKEKNFIWK